jgi:hypothetical protein
LLALHVLSGAVAVLAGAMAAFARKGGRAHIRAGRLFVTVMVVSSLLGAVLGLIRFEFFFITFFAGLLATYLVVSGWLAARPSASTHRALEVVLSAFNAIIFAALIAIGGIALARSDGMMFGFAGENYLLLAGMSGIALIADISRLFRARMSREHRTARHLWRMLLGFFIAVGSAFTGPGASVFPNAVRDSGVLSLPELVVLLLLLFYLVRTLFLARRRDG